MLYRGQNNKHNHCDSGRITESEMNHLKRRLLVVGLDIGTTYSGCAYSFNYEYETDPLKIHTFTQETRSRGPKTPTAVLFHKSRDEMYFGTEAEAKFAEMKDTRRNEWLFFREFKMNLYHDSDLSRRTVLESVGAEHYPAIEVFSKAIAYFKKHLLECISDELTGITMADINWVITVPAIWNDAAKQFMIEAAEKAGIQKDHLALSLEPEVASLYCRILPVGKSNDSSKKVDVSKPGTNFMTLDIGGGTVDVTVLEIQSDGRLKEMDKASGGAWGGTKVDEAFIKKLHEYFGQSVYEDFARECPEDLLELLSSFEQTKRKKSCASEEEWVSIYIPYDLRCRWDRKKQSSEYKWSGDKLRLKKEVFNELFEPSIRSIIIHLQELFKKPALKNVSTIFMVGGYSECSLLQEAIKKKFEHVNVRVPRDAWSAVMLGAVLFGHDQSMVCKRVSRKTYGIKINTKFDPKVHPISKKHMAEGMEKCKDIFESFLTVDQTYENGEEIDKVFYPLSSFQTQVAFHVYISPHADVKYTTDPDCVMLGKLTLHIPDTSKGRNRPLDVTFKVGGTFLEVNAKNRETGDEVSANFDFLSS